MPKIIAMIPARLGSKRVKKKNLRLINGKPLISYVIETAKSANCFDGIYINSEAEIFGKIADEYGIQFYQRPDHLASDTATNDEFALDFIQNVDGDVLIQLLPTSPLLTVDEVRAFVTMMQEGDYDTLISVEDKQIACVYQETPINFDRFIINPPSQTMTPVRAYATVLMGWHYKNYQENMERYGSAYHGGNGKIGYFELRGLSTVDIDREKDFLLAESILRARCEQQETVIEYYDSKSREHSEVDVPSILAKDGVINNDLHDANKELVNIDDIIEVLPKNESWSKRIIDTENNSMTLISQLPGEGNRLHYHPNWNEWWYIVDGEWEWEIEGEKKIVQKGDLVFMRKNRQHKITAVGNKPAIRMAVSRADVAHVYPEK